MTDLDAGTYMIHDAPMKLVDRITDLTDTTVRATAMADEGSLFDDGDGRVEAMALVEMAVQAVSAKIGYETRHDKPKPGLFVGINSAEFHGRARCGQTLEIDAAIAMTFDQFIVIEATVSQSGATLLTAMLKVWLADDENLLAPTERKG